ncbi:MAG TPA: hypothetical protein VLG27_02230 [Candidatus Saccharimonadia bacterium]|nr:hypothetical protein [Candidatus Saccharimonadia bacterium]
MKMVFGGMSAIILLIGAGGAFYITHSYKNPLPANIKSQVSYKAIYPSKTKQIDPASYDYRPDQKTLTFIANVAGNNIVFTEQPAPESLGSAGQIYYPALGIHPYAQFATKLGPVALARFWQSGSLKPAGQSGILASGGTFLTAHSDKNLTNTEWKDLFDSLKITK